MMTKTNLGKMFTYRGKKMMPGASFEKENLIRSQTQMNCKVYAKKTVSSSFKRGLLEGKCQCYKRCQSWVKADVVQLERME